MNEQDKKILQLKEVVTKKREEVNQAEKPRWRTNCVFKFRGSEELYNLNVISDPRVLVEILGYLKNEEMAFDLAKTQLGLKNLVFTYRNYSIHDWEADLKTRNDVIHITMKKKELEDLEKKLDSLISSDTKTSLIISDIEKLLNVE